MDRKKILIIGAGPLSFQIIQMLALRSNFQIFVASRDL
jgi:saccharopine dehydrogenase-like NADP-dependent oxidoreductase